METSWAPGARRLEQLDRQLERPSGSGVAILGCRDEHQRAGHPPVALVHDYLTQRGGAERVVLQFIRAFPDAPLYTSFYEPTGTFPAFADTDVHPGALNRLSPFRHHHRAALPLLAPWFSSQLIDAAVTFCSSSGWAHGVRTTGRKVVYCHTPARWLYQTAHYLTRRSSLGSRMVLEALRPGLERWDRWAARTADRFVVNSTEVARRVRDAYGRPAEVLVPPPALSPALPQEPIEALEPGYWLCVARLLPYKNVGAVIEAFNVKPARRLVVVGRGPEGSHLRRLAGPTTIFLDQVSDRNLGWLYAHCQAVVTASREDLGLVPLEAAAFGKPVAALRFGGHLDTVVHGTTGVLFEPTRAALAAALDEVEATKWAPDTIAQHANRFSADAFTQRLRQIASEEGALL